MGLFDKMFGRGATAAEGQADAQKRFNELKTKYQSVLNTIEREDVRLANLHVEGNKRRREKQGVGADQTGRRQ